MDADKVRDANGKSLTDVEVRFRVRFPGGERGDAARALRPEAVNKSPVWLRPAGRTVGPGTPIATRIG